MVPIEFKSIFIVFWGLALMLGLISKKRVGKIIGGMVFFPVLLVVAWNMFQTNLMHLVPIEQVLSMIVVIIILLLFLLMGTSFGREVFASLLANFLYDLVKGIKIIFSGLGKLISRIFLILRRQ